MPLPRCARASVLAASSPPEPLSAAAAVPLPPVSRLGAGAARRVMLPSLSASSACSSHATVVIPAFERFAGPGRYGLLPSGLGFRV